MNLGKQFCIPARRPAGSTAIPSTRLFSRRGASALGLAALFCLAGTSRSAGQELEPGAFSPAPVGMNILIAAFAYNTGDLAFDPSGPIQNGHADISASVLGYVRTLDVAGRSSSAALVLGYAKGPLNVAAAYGVTKTATSDDFKVTNAGASYEFGAVTAMLMGNVSRYGAKKLTNLELGVVARIGVGQLRASVQRADASGAGTDANDARQLALGYVHYLSKRTALYATASTISNKGAAAFVVGSPPAAAAGRTSRGYEVGMMHSF